MASPQLAAYYSNLLIAQYRTKPKAVAEIQAYAQAALGGPNYFWGQWLTAFNLDTAVGPQLDILGQWIGLSRNIGTPTAYPWFGFVDAVTANPQNPNGFQDATMSATNAATVFYDATYFGTRNTALSDTAYRFMLKLKALLNVNDNTLGSVDELLEVLFGNQITVVDNMNMTLTYTVTGTFPVSTALLLAYLPRPMGVAITVNTPTSSLTRVLMDGTTTRVLMDGTTVRVT